jgi:Spy/CpxP family protein refolding chaperone
MKAIRKTGIGLAVLTLGVALLPGAWAQDDAPGAMQGPGQMQGPGEGQGMRGRHMDPQRQLKHMTRELGLNHDQQQQVGQILQDRDAQMEALRQNTALPPQQRRQQAMAAMRDSDAKIRGVLNPGQQQKFDAMRAQQMQRMQEHRGGMGGQGIGGPPPQDGGGPPPPPDQQ